MDVVVFPQIFDPTFRSFSDPSQLESYPAEAQVSSERQATAIAHQRKPTGCALASSSRPAGAEKHVVGFTVAPDLYIGNPQNGPVFLFDDVFFVFFFEIGLRSPLFVETHPKPASWRFAVLLWNSIQASGDPLA